MSPVDARVEATRTGDVTISNSTQNPVRPPGVTMGPDSILMENKGSRLDLEQSGDYLYVRSITGGSDSCKVRVRLLGGRR